MSKCYLKNVFVENNDNKLYLDFRYKTIVNNYLILEQVFQCTPWNF